MNSRRFNKTGNNLKSWVDYWAKDGSSSERIAQFNIDFFIKSTEEIMSFNPNDIVLDIGSGYCHLAEAISSKVKEIHCADVSEFYLNKSRERLGKFKNVFFYRLDEKNYTDLKNLQGLSFSKIICLSVVQYYKNIGEIENLISNVRKIAARGAKLIIADIPSNQVGTKEALRTIAILTKRGLFIQVLWHFLRLWLGPYNQLYKESGILSLDIDSIFQLEMRLNITIKILKIPLTINPNRYHLLISFD